MRYIITFLCRITPRAEGEGAFGFQIGRSSRHKIADNVPEHTRRGYVPKPFLDERHFSLLVGTTVICTGPCVPGRKQTSADVISQKIVYAI